MDKGPTVKVMTTAQQPAFADHALNYDYAILALSQSFVAFLHKMAYYESNALLFFDNICGCFIKSAYCHSSRGENCERHAEFKVECSSFESGNY